MTRPRILIVTSSPLCKNPRVLKEARTLGHNGYDVTVLTIAGRETDENTDGKLLQNTPFKKVALPYFGFHGAFGLGAFTSRIFTSLARKLVPLDIERRSALGAFHRLSRAARATPADLTIVHTELGLAVGCALLETGRHVAADLEDWHSRDLLPVARRHRPQGLLEKIEQTMLSQAAYVTTTSQSLATAVHTTHGGQEPTVLTNSFPLQPLRPPRDAAQIPAFIWFSQTIGPGRGVEAFVQAWLRTSSPSRLVLLGGIDDGYKNQLLALTRASDRPPVEILPICPPDALPAIIASHDLGLALEENSPPNKDLTISNKILQYLNAGLAVIATPTAGHQEVLQHEPRAGVFIDPANPSDCARILDSLLSNPAALAVHQQAARELAKRKYCWENEEPKLLALVEKALASRPA